MIVKLNGAVLGREQGGKEKCIHQLNGKIIVCICLRKNGSR